MLNLRARRKELGLTLKEVADAIGVSESCVSRYESGSIKNMRRNVIEKYADVLCVDPVEFIKIGAGQNEAHTDPVLRRIVHELQHGTPQMRQETLDYILFRKGRDRKL